MICKTDKKRNRDEIRAFMEENFGRAVTPITLMDVRHQIEGKLRAFAESQNIDCEVKIWARPNDFDKNMIDFGPDNPATKDLIVKIFVPDPENTQGLLACPFCESLDVEMSEKFEHGSPREHFVRCKSCWAEGPHKWQKDDRKDREDAKLAWNHRQN